MTSISSARPRTARRMVFTMMNRTMAPMTSPWSKAARLSELEPNIGKGERGGMAVLRHAKSPEA